MLVVKPHIRNPTPHNQLQENYDHQGKNAHARNQQAEIVYRCLCLLHRRQQSSIISAPAIDSPNIERMTPL